MDEQNPAIQGISAGMKPLNCVSLPIWRSGIRPAPVGVDSQAFPLRFMICAHPSRPARHAAALVLAAITLALPRLAPASDAIFLCVDADGRKTYQNADDGSTCRRLDGLEISVPVPGDRSPGRTLTARSLYAHPAVALPGGIARVDASTQRLRDSDRRSILEDELRTEQGRLQQLQQQYRNGHPATAADESPESAAYRARVQTLADDIDRSEGNIASLRRELGGTRN